MKLNDSLDSETNIPVLKKEAENYDPAQNNFKDSFYYLIAKVYSDGESFIGFLGAAVGFVFFLMPLISPTLRDILRGMPLLYFVFDEVTKLSPVVVVILMSVVLLASVTQALALSKGFPNGWNVHQRGGLPTAKQVVDCQLFPVSRMEKTVFILWAALKLFEIVFWAFPFACLAYFMRIGEIK